jgi:uncharacterized protein (TIGR00159 family)
MVNYIVGIFQDIRFTDILDIGIIAAFLYMGLVWLKKARARFILIGIIIFGSIYVVARFLGLYLTTMVFQGFFAIFLIMIVVIFQEDLRHFFERLGVWGITRGRWLKISFIQDVDILSSALANLSRKQIGALIVIRGKEPLDRHLEAGLHLDGLLSQILLESIFEPHTPGHDGAIIIDRGRVTMFGCHLPLSSNVNEIGHLGTRHAAALGLTERTDALCIVLSQEQGIVSVAERGSIKQLSGFTELHSVLEDFYHRIFPVKKRTPFVDFLKGHSIEKITAVFIACGIWLAFGHRPEIIRRDFLIPIEYRNLAPDCIIEEPKSKEITITLSGSERIFNLLKPKDLKLSLDMSNVKEGENAFVLTKDLIPYPTGLSMVNIEPDEIRLKVYKMIPRSIPIEVKTNGRPPSRIKIREIKVEPKEVSIIVPSNQGKVAITTEPIDLKSITETITLSPKLIITPGIRFPEGKPPEIKVTIEVEKK